MLNTHFVQRQAILKLLLMATLVSSVVDGASLGAGPIDVLDQEYTNSSTRATYFLGAFEPAQIITAGMSGQLSRIEVLVSRRTSDRDPLIMHIYDTLNSTPNNLLASFSIPYDQVLGENLISWTWATFDVNSANLEVVPNTQLAISLTTATTSNYGWNVSAEGTPPNLLYAGGQAYFRMPSTGTAWNLESNSSRCFQTYVLPVVEPSSLILLGMAIIGLLAYARPRRK